MSEAAPNADHVHGIVDRLFGEYGDSFGADVDIYRGHVQRVVGLVAMQVDIVHDLVEPIGVAAFFHDSAIWLDQTWDYLAPSQDRAVRYLDDDTHHDLVRAIITQHHRIRSADHDDPIIEAFRRADMADISFGLLPVPGASRHDYKELVRRYPAADFRPMLARAFGRGLRERPSRPLPMIKL